MLSLNQSFLEVMKTLFLLDESHLTHIGLLNRIAFIVMMSFVRLELFQVRLLTEVLRKFRLKSCAQH